MARLVGEDVTPDIYTHYKKDGWAKKLEKYWASDLVRLIAVPDEDPDTSTWEKEEFDLANRDGVWGLIGEYKNPLGEWEQADAVWGFVGMSFIGSGYDQDIAENAMKHAAGLQTAEVSAGLKPIHQIMLDVLHDIEKRAVSASDKKEVRKIIRHIEEKE